MFKNTSFSLLFSSLLLVTLVSSQSSTCSVNCVRQEWRNLTTTEQATYINAIVTAYTKDPTTFRGFSTTHNTNGNLGIHHTAHFLPWHRWFLMSWQKFLRVYSPNLCLAHWTSAIDTSDVSLAPVFGPNAFGYFGSDSSTCIQLGPDKIQIIDTLGNCLTRQRDQGWSISPLATVNALISSGDAYNVFSNSLEVGYHSDAHIVLGQQMSTYYSPIDPLFFMHHCEIDRVWAKWQSLDFNVRLSQLIPVDGQSFATLETLDSPLIAAATFTVRDMMDISTLCYSYAFVDVKPGSNPTPTPPPSPTNNTNTTTDTTNQTVFTSIPAPIGVAAACLQLPGLQTTQCVNSTGFVKRFGQSVLNFFTGATASSVRTYISYLNPYLVTIPAPMNGPSWCRWYPGVPRGFCLDSRKMAAADVTKLGGSSVTYTMVRAYMSSHLSTIVAVTPNLKRRFVMKNNVLDLGEIGYLKVPHPLPDFWIKMNKFDDAFVKSEESKKKAMIEQLNSLSGYLPASSLIAQEDDLHRVISKYAGTNYKIHLLYKGKDVTVAHQDDVASTVKQIVAAREKLETGPRPTVAQLAAIIGAPTIPEAFKYCSDADKIGGYGGNNNNYGGGNNHGGGNNNNNSGGNNNNYSGDNNHGSGSNNNNGGGNNNNNGGDNNHGGDNNNHGGGNNNNYSGDNNHGGGNNNNYDRGNGK